MISPRIFLIGHMDAEEHSHLGDYLDWYLNHLGIAPAHAIVGVRNNPDNTNVPLMRCNEIFNRFGVPRWSELWPDANIADWRRNEQDTYIRDGDWVLHARVGDFIDFDWTRGDPKLLADWMDQHEFDCVKGEVVEHYAQDHLPVGRTPWQLYPDTQPTGEHRVAMARGYWYVCDDGNLCPQFEEAAWDFPRPLVIRRLTYQVRPATGHAAHGA